MTVTLTPVTDHRTHDIFVRFPWRIYADNPVWVPPLLLERRRTLDPHRNAFFSHARARLWLAYRDGVPVGTIAAFIDQRANQHHQEHAGYFGFFEVLPDPAAAAALLDAAADWVCSQGMTVLRGPCNFAYDNDCGLLLNAYDRPPTLMTSYNPPYYPAYLEQAGFQQLYDWYAYRIDRATIAGDNLPQFLDRLHRSQRHIRRRSITVRPAQINRFGTELASVQHVYNNAWEQNHGFIALDNYEVAQFAATLRSVVDPDLVLFAEVAGQVVGVSVALPDINTILQRLNGRLLPFGWWQLIHRRRSIDTLRFFAMGVLPEYRYRGIEAAFYYTTFHTAIAKGYQRAELSLVHEQNHPMRRSAEAFGAWIDKTYRIYQRTLT